MNNHHVKKISYLVFLVYCVSFCQKTVQIKGRVFGGDVPLNGAAVYNNNSMLGTTTNENGEFTLSVNQKNIELIVSYLGFETIKYDLNTDLYQRPIKFVLVEKEEFLKEIVLKKIKYDKEWQYNLEQFITEFIGKSEFAKYCKITNPKTLFFDFDKTTNELTTYAKEPLLIKNDALGYDVYFDLISL
ncbi:MAG: carboxypeptidase-like regulatory domain-containing protein [Polaribacter sp.]|nr:carboxypeptidase-like regulatory domain-containing protein [Polaribacter sp.]